jgi:hypothetical protein
VAPICKRCSDKTAGIRWNRFDPQLLIESIIITTPPPLPTVNHSRRYFRTIPVVDAALADRFDFFLFGVALRGCVTCTGFVEPSHYVILNGSYRHRFSTIEENFATIRFFPVAYFIVYLSICSGFARTSPEERRKKDDLCAQDLIVDF